MYRTSTQVELNFVFSALKLDLFKCFQNRISTKIIVVVTLQVDVYFYIFVLQCLVISAPNMELIVTHMCCESQVKWHEICLSIPAAILEVLNAWENGVLSVEAVQVRPKFSSFHGRKFFFLSLIF